MYAYSELQKIMKAMYIKSLHYKHFTNNIATVSWHRQNQFGSGLHCIAGQGGKGSTQGNVLKKAGLSFNFYKIFLVAVKNSNTCRITIISNAKIQ